MSTISCRNAALRVWPMVSALLALAAVVLLGLAHPAAAQPCTADSQCVSGYYCTGVVGMPGQCLQKKSNGVACTIAKECNSGYCVDGVCCTGSCSGGSEGIRPSS